MLWKEKYRVGVPLIDQQHEELFERVSNFIKTALNGAPWEERMESVKETMYFMQDYVIVHFDEEEKLQQSIGYPDYPAHHEAHELFKKGIDDYVVLFNEEGFSEEKIQEFAGKLMTWLIVHVGKTDQKIGEFYMKDGGL